ncbi:MAG TPA: HlyD family efflux transporter periplasmic adaptor subunit [Chitinophagaceae bacterium]|nr:HlyD family efflux transporter periplasmic adaptor subunit [Chitinophagaceae bacterium]
MKKIIIPVLIAVSLAACNNKNSDHDASGTFETTETIIAAEANGIIKQFNIEEGQVLKEGQYIGYIDSVQLYLKKKQLESQIRSLLSKTPDVATQTNAFKKQLAVTQTRLAAQLIEKKRIENLVKADAATPKQLDDITALTDALQKELDVIRGQEAAQNSILQTQTAGLVGETAPLKVQIEQLNDQLANCRIINKVNGTVLTKYAEANEMATNGKPLYKIADLSSLILRAYISGNQLSSVKLNQPVKVLVDDANGKFKEYPGIIEWISNKAEFTPKTIQTKDERANLVYAVNIRVKNDGYLKIGMYADVKL